MVKAFAPVAAVKELLGHNSVKTTERYLHLARHTMEKSRSPLDIWRERDNLGLGTFGRQNF